MVSFLGFATAAYVVFKAGGSFVRFIRKRMLLKSTIKERGKMHR